MMKRLLAIALFFCLSFHICAGETGAILFLGDSLTDGYTLGKEIAYPTHIQQYLEDNHWPYRVVNAGVTGNTSSDALKRLPKLLEERVDVLVVALGANDMIRGIPTDEMRYNLRKIVQKTRKKYPDVSIVLVGLKPHWTWRMANKSAAKVYPELAEELEVEYVESMLEGVANTRRKMMDDGVHPNAEGHKTIANTVWRALERVLRTRG